MEELATWNHAIVSSENIDSPPPHARNWKIILGLTFARFGCAALLLIASALKAYQLFTDPALGVLHGSHWLQAGFVDYELLLAIWLLSGVALEWGRRIVLVTFLCFGCYSFFLGISGKESCGCFGKAHVSPWWTFSIDVTLAFLLFVWKPQRGKGNFESKPRCVHFAVRSLLVVALTFAVTGISILSISVWRPGAESSIENSLANSRFVFLEPEKWIGKPFPLMEYIDIAERERLSRGTWIIVFYHHDCSKCQQALFRYKQLAEQLGSTDEGNHIALIEVPPFGPIKLTTNPLFHLGHLNGSKVWLITTPTEVRVTDGQVIAATSELVSEGQ